MGGSAAAGAPHACRRSPALRLALLLLLLLLTLAAPASHAALTATSATIRVVAADVGAHSFSASLRATSTARVGQVAWVVWETAACGGTVPSDSVVKAGTDCNGVALDASQAGQVDLVRPASPRARAHAPDAASAGRAENAVEPGGSARRAWAAFANKLHAVPGGRGERHRRAAGRARAVPARCLTRARRAGLSVVTLDDTPPMYAPGTPRLLAVGERGASFRVGLNEPGLLRYVLQPSVASPPTLNDVLTGRRRERERSAVRSLAPGADAQRGCSTIRRAVPVGGAQETEYVLDGVEGDSAYALYVAASDVATPTPNTKARGCTAARDVASALTHRMPRTGEA